NNQAADQRGIHAVAQIQPLAVAAAQVAQDRSALSLRQLDRADDRAADWARVALAILLERLHDSRQPVQHALARHREQEITHLARRVGWQRRVELLLQRRAI